LVSRVFSLIFIIYKEEILLEPNAGKYFFINQGMLTIDKVDDAQEMRDTKKAFDVLMFTQVTIIHFCLVLFLKFHRKNYLI